MKDSRSPREIPDPPPLSRPRYDICSWAVQIDRPSESPMKSRECLGHHRKGTPGTGNVYEVFIK